MCEEKWERERWLRTFVRTSVVCKCTASYSRDMRRAKHISHTILNAIAICTSFTAFAAVINRRRCYCEQRVGVCNQTIILQPRLKKHATSYARINCNLNHNIINVWFLTNIIHHLYVFYADVLDSFP